MPKIVDREEMQHDILDAAMQVYMAKGYHSATIADVAKTAGVGKGTLYLYFENKEAIVVAMVENHFAGLEDRFFGPQVPETLEAFARRLTKTMKISDEHARFIRVFFEVFGPSFASDAFVGKVSAFFDKLGRHYADQFIHLQEIGEIRKDGDPQHLGRALAAIVDGVIVHRGLFGIAESRHAKMRTEAVAVILRGLSPR